MSTRGFLSFAVDGETKTSYVHHSAHPEGLGLTVLAWLLTADFAVAKSAAQALRVVSESDEPTAQDITRLWQYYDPNVGGRSEHPTWYQLLRGTQGDPAAILDAGVIEDASSFPAESLFAEWGYVIDFDTQALEVYCGFQEEPHDEGRFAALAPTGDGYWPVRLTVSWPLDALPSDAVFTDDVERAEAGA
ncbi:hypothetical protein ACH4FX_12280 [Streptomyces sp. NPDC018019]|uniref:hypothetical protein n=1 Tax=Streptomyces sp. NPDC018019 TaxID=3365030 RepID=UPI00379DE8EF